MIAQILPSLSSSRRGSPGIGISEELRCIVFAGFLATYSRLTHNFTLRFPEIERVLVTVVWVIDYHPRAYLLSRAAGSIGGSGFMCLRDGSTRNNIESQRIRKQVSQSLRHWMKMTVNLPPPPDDELCIFVPHGNPNAHPEERCK